MGELYTSKLIFQDLTPRLLQDLTPRLLVDLADFLKDAVYVSTPKKPCKHENVKHVAHFEKIKRYKVVCEKCEKFMKWLPNKEALALGYSLE